MESFSSEKKKKAFITGITGQDGSYLAEFLLNRGYEVHGLIRRVALEDQNKRLERINHIKDKIIIHPGSVEDYPRVMEIVGEIKPDEFYHLSAQTFVKDSFDDPSSTFNININGTLNVLRAIQRNSPQTKFYFAGTSEMFGKSTNNHQNEDTPLYPKSPYGISKIAGFHMTRNYREAFNIFACSGILFNHESPRRGKEFVTRKITSFVANMEKDPNQVLELGNLDSKRDWGFSRDYIEAMWLMLQQEEPDDYVIATGGTHSVKEFVEEAFKVIGINIEWEGEGINQIGKYDGKVIVRVNKKFFRPAEIDLLIGDYSKARNNLGWRPKTDFRELVRMMVESDLKMFSEEDFSSKNEDNIPIAEPSLNNKELEYVTDATKSGWISSKGKYVGEFEKEFSRYCNVQYGVSCCNGTAAIHLALLALGIKEGDEVILPASTYISTANAVRYINAKPIFVDSDMETWTIDPNKIEEKINERTKAIIPVHLYGMPCDMGKIIEIAKKHNLYVIEDCAEAHGAEYKNKKVGSLGDIGCFSFFGNKIITTGEGGMCVTNNKELKEKIKKLRNQGADEKNKYWHDIVGYNYKLTNIQAAIGLAQLRKINYFLECKKENAELYSTFLNDVPEIKMIQKKEDRKNVHWMNIILSNKKNEIMLALEKENIETRPFFIPINKMPPYYSSESYPIAEEMNKKGINLPSSTKLKKEEIKKICDIIKKVMKNEV